MVYVAIVWIQSRTDMIAVHFSVAFSMTSYCTDSLMPNPIRAQKGVRFGDLGWSCMNYGNDNLIGHWKFTNRGF